MTGVCASDLGLARSVFGAQLHLLRFPLLGVGIPKHAGIHFSLLAWVSSLENLVRKGLFWCLGLGLQSVVLPARQLW